MDQPLANVKQDASRPSPATCLSSAQIIRIKEIVERLVAMNSWAA